MNDKVSNEYDIHFKKFYRDLFKFQAGSKKQLTCSGCKCKKRFIIGETEITYSCGPKHSKDKKCGPQYTIELPKYINYRSLELIYNSEINGSFNYSPNNHLEYNLKNLSSKMNVKTDLEKQIAMAKKASESLQKIKKDFITANELNEHNITLKKLSELRYKNSIEKKKIMKLLDTELPEEKRIDLRRKYAVLISENQEFIDMIIILRRPVTNYIMIKNASIKNHVSEKEDKDKDKHKDKDKDKDKDKLSFSQQVKILIKFYGKVDADKTEDDIKRIINNRRPQGTPPETRIPTNAWLDLCKKLEIKYDSIIT